MMTFQNIVDLVERFKTPYIRISDMHGNRIACIEETNNVSATLKELVALEPVLKAYGKLEVVAATNEVFKASYKGAYKWLLVFEQEKTNNNSVQGLQQNWGLPPVGYVSNEVMMAKLETIQKQFEWEKEKAELKRKDSIKEYLPFLPAMLTIMGYPADNVNKINAAMGTIGAIKKEEKPITLTFKDVETMSEEDKNNRIETLMNSLAGKISAEHMIILLEALDKKPELAIKAVNLLPML